MGILSRGKQKRVTEDIARQAAAQSASHAARNLQAATDETVSGMNLFLKAAQSSRNVDFDQRKGNLFEYIEAAKFNRNAARAGAGTRAVVTAADGRPHDPSDIDLVRGGKVIRQVQAKFADTQKGATDTSAATSAFYQAGGQSGHWGKYRSMQRLIRKDDSYKIDPETGKPISLLEETRRLAQKRADVNGGLHADEYRDVVENLTDELTDETTGVTSGGTTLEEMQLADQNPRAYAGQFKMRQYAEEIQGSAAAGAASGAIMSGVVSGISNTFAVLQDEKSLVDAAKEIGVTTGKGAVRGGATGGLSAILRIGGKNHGIPVISDSAAATVIAGGIIDTGAAIYAYAQGELSEEQLREELTDTVIKSTVTIYMSKAAALALGGYGAVLPMAVYSVSSYMVACTREIMENARLNAEAYHRLAALLDEETALVYQQKERMEEQLERYLDDRYHSMSELLGRFEHIMEYGGNYDEAIYAIISYADQAGIALQHTSKADFDRAMRSRKDFVLR